MRASWRPVLCAPTLAPGPLAQLAEQQTFNLRVQSSILWRPTVQRDCRCSAPCSAMLDETRYCSASRRHQPLTAFSRRRASPDGLQARCKDCWRQWYLVINKEQHIAAVSERAARRVPDHRRRTGEQLGYWSASGKPPGSAVHT